MFRHILTVLVYLIPFMNGKISIPSTKSLSNILNEENVIIIFERFGMSSIYLQKNNEVYVFRHRDGEYPYEWINSEMTKREFCYSTVRDINIDVSDITGIVF
jgi:hypothetical protein